MKSLNLHKLRTLTALLSFAALLAAPQAFAADITPPTLESLRLYPSEINVTDGPASVYVEFRVTDDESGIETPIVTAFSETTTQGASPMPLSVLSSSYDGLNILYKQELVIKQGSAPGPWELYMFALRDKQGNSTGSGFLRSLGFDITFTVVEDTPDQQSNDASSSSSDDSCSGWELDCSSDTGSGDSTTSGSSSDAQCDPQKDFGCRVDDPPPSATPVSSSDDNSGNTSGTVSSLGVTLEEPAVGLVHMGVGNLRGWAVSSAGIRKVEAFLDGESLGEIPYGGARSDVGLAFPDIDGSDQSGFGMSFNYSGLSAGTHTIEVVAHSIDNKTASDSAQFETVRFDSEFIGAGEVINLNAAASVLTNDQIRVENISIAGKYYNLLLRWRTAEQGFEIVEIEALD